MNTYIARQPVFDKDMNTVAYSLYYRSSELNQATSKGDEATASVILNGPLQIGFDKLTGQLPAIIKFTAALLVNETALLLRPEKMMVELVDPEEKEALLDTMNQLRAFGYRISVSSNHDNTIIKELLSHIDFITIDFTQNGVERIKELLLLTKGRPVDLMAYKVETQEQYEFAKKMNFKWFQGNFFMAPSLIQSKTIRSLNSSYLKLMVEIMHPDPDFDRISQTIAEDLGLAYKLLRLINSTAFKGVQEITNIHQAIVRIGYKELHKWLSLIIIHEVTKERPSVYASTSMIRAKAMENLANAVPALRPSREALFICGMFSQLDVILEKPMSEVLGDLPLSRQVREALLHRSNELGAILDMMIHYERLELEQVPDKQLDDFGFSRQDMINSYVQAINWSTTLF